MIFKIGRASDNDFVVSSTQQDVSRYHCEIHISDKTLLLIDKESKNGTFVDELMIEKLFIKENSAIKLGNYQLSSNEFWDELQKYIQEKKIDFSHEMSNVLVKMKNYESKRQKVNKQHSRIPFLLRIIPSFIAILILILFPNLIPDQYRTAVFILATTIGTGFSLTFGNDQMKKNISLEKLKLEYEDILLCPKCKSQLILHGGSTYWSGKNECQNNKCDAQFQNAKLS